MRDSSPFYSAPTPAGIGAIDGNLGNTDNRLVRADGSGGGTAQASTITVDDVGNIVYPMTPVLWSSGVGFTVYSLSSVNGDSTLEIAYMITRTAGGSASTRVGIARLHLKRSAGVWTVENVTDTAITPTYAPTQAWEISGDTLVWKITSVGSSGEACWHVREYRASFNLRDGA